MAVFRYQGRDNNGVLTSGAMTAHSSSDVAKKLMDNQITPTSINKQANFPLLCKHIVNIFRRLGTVNKSHLLNFTSQMAILLKARLPAEFAIRQLQKSTPSPKLKYILEIIAERMAEGESLSSAFKGFPTIFSPLYVALLEQSQHTETPHTVFEDLATTLKTSITFRRNFVAGLVIPIYVMFLTLIVIIVSDHFVMPNLIRMYKHPEKVYLITKYLISFTHFMANLWPYLLGGLVLLLIIIHLLKKHQPFNFAYDYVMLHLPFFGRPRKLSALIRLSETLYLGLQNTMPMHQAMYLAHKAIHNGYLKKQLLGACEDLNHGLSCSQALKSRKLFDSLGIHLLEMGEQSNQIAASLKNLSTIYQAEYEARSILIRNIITIIVMMLAVGLMLFYTLGIYFGIFSLFRGA
jgi:type II secretory pathway component PulF